MPALFTSPDGLTRFLCRCHRHQAAHASFTSAAGLIAAIEAFIDG